MKRMKMTIASSTVTSSGLTIVFRKFAPGSFDARLTEEPEGFFGGGGGRLQEFQFFKLAGHVLVLWAMSATAAIRYVNVDSPNPTPTPT